MENQALFDFFEKYLPLQKEEKSKIETYFRLKKVKRKEMLLKEGSVCKEYAFVISGCFRMFGVDDRGYEHNIQFVAENDWIADISSFYTEKPSQLNIVALEASEVLEIKQQDLYFLYNEIPLLNRIFKVMIEHKYIELQNRVL